MNSFNTVTNITGLLVFTIATAVYALTAEPTGSLWDCGEFILGAYKMQVVHPPGAPLFMIVGRMFIWVAEIFTDTVKHPENIAYAVNLMSGVFTALGAMLVAWVTMIFGKLIISGREQEPKGATLIALAFAGIVAGLTMTFSTSIWFSAVEGEVYAMSTFFTVLTLWSMVKWYNLPDTPVNDRWLVFVVFSGAMSIGVHLLSLLTFPALALFYYFKKYKVHTVWGMLIAAVMGVLAMGAIQSIVIAGIATAWREMELIAVNTLGLPYHSGFIPTMLLLIALFFFGFRYANHNKRSDLIGLGVSTALFLILAYSLKAILVIPLVYLIFRFFLQKAERHLMQVFLASAMMSVIGFSTIGVIVIRANADPPVNMNRPSDPIRLLSYVNREQYGERPLLFGPNFDAQPIDNKIEQRFGQVVQEVNGKKQERYEIVDEKISYIFNNSDKVLFPRMGDDQQGRPEKYRAWIGKPSGPLNFADNLKFFFRYQLNWMYWRYFAWNFIGRQNADQGYYSWEKRSGHWESGIKFIDDARLFKTDKLPDTLKNEKSKNHYYFLPFLLGLFGLWFHFRSRSEEALALFALFIITGIGIIVYSNQPPNEPRERDYVLVGSFFTFSIWVGLSVIAIFQLLRNRINGSVATAAGALVLVAPLLMGFQNWDDHDRSHHYGARDYASNFLESCQPNAIIFTYGDNDTYPLWYVQEVEGIRRDVRVVNLSLIQVDWYIDLLRRKVNESEPLKLTVPKEAYRGNRRNTIFYYNPSGKDSEMDLIDLLKFVGAENKLSASGGRSVETYLPSRAAYISVDSSAAVATGAYNPALGLPFSGKIPVRIPDRQYITKDELAILDVIASNINERPVYFSVTCRPDKMFGVDNYTQLEGMGLRIIPVRSESDPNLYIYGFGRVDTDIAYNNVMNKFKWGNFNKKPTFIDRSYAPSMQAIRLLILRTAKRLTETGNNEQAVAIIEKYFEAFPHFNFPYDWNTMQMINIMTAAGANDKAKPHIETLAKETKQYLDFLNSLGPDMLGENGEFGQDYSIYVNTQDLVTRTVDSMNDPEFASKIKAIFGTAGSNPK
jgi:hypothetical protein